jgi:hypothetical protein
VIFELQAALARHRRAVLAVATVPVVVAIVARLLGIAPDVIMPVLFLVLLGATALMLTIMWAPSVRRRMPVFVVGEGVFRTPEGGADVAAGVTALALIAFLTPVPPELFDEGVLRTAAVVLFPLFAAGHLTALWRPAGLAVSAGGLHATGRFGSMTVPWEALDEEQPDHDSGPIPLHLADPGLVRTTGWMPRRAVTIESGREASVAAAIRYYLAEPGERAGIGTPDGYVRLLSATGSAVDGRLWQS